MTDKQIIIDGIDISKCKHYDEVFNYCDQSYLGEGGLLKNTKNPKRCECSPNCYYKQLKRKEQELKNICKAFDIEYAIDEETGNLIGRCNKLYKKEQECEKLKHKVELMMDCESCKVNEYKQTLTEIKEIAKNNMDDKEIMAVQTILNGSPDIKNKVLKKIIQKCEEVNNDK